MLQTRRDQDAESIEGGKVWGGVSPLQPTGEPEEHCKLPQWGSGQSSGR